MELALTLWITALRLLLLIQANPQLPPSFIEGGTIAANQAIVYAQDIINNPTDMPKTTSKETTKSVTESVPTTPEPVLSKLVSCEDDPIISDISPTIVPYWDATDSYVKVTFPLVTITSNCTGQRWVLDTKGLPEKVTGSPFKQNGGLNYYQKYTYIGDSNSIFSVSPTEDVKYEVTFTARNLDTDVSVYKTVNFTIPKCELNKSCI